MRRYWCVRLCSIFFLLFIFCQVVHASGYWVFGTVAVAPFSNKNFTYMVVDEVKYTIMKETAAKLVYEKKGHIYEDYFRIGKIRQGDQVQVKVEGNRIYDIRVLR